MNLSIQASLFGLLVCVAFFVYFSASWPWLHRTSAGKTLLGLVIALIAVAVPVSFGLKGPGLGDSLPVAWFSLVLGPVAANFIHEGICMRAAGLQTGFDNAQKRRLRLLEKQAVASEKRIDGVKKERDECKSKATAHDTFVVPKVEQLDNLIGELLIELADLEDEIDREREDLNARSKGTRSN